LIKAPLVASACWGFEGNGPSEEMIELNPCPPLSVMIAGVLQLGVADWNAVSSVVGDILIVGCKVQLKGSDATVVAVEHAVTTMKGMATASTAMGT
jgi:hypothetical protein